MSNIKERVIQIAVQKHVTKERFCQLIGSTYGNFKGKNKNTPINSDVLANILTLYPDINADWLISGMGEILIADNRQNIGKNINLTDEDQINFKNHSYGIPLIAISALAGVFNGDISVLEYECERYVIPAFKEADFLISVKGSSMYPKYSSGDIVACKKLPMDTFFQWNKVYVLDTDQGPLIKRVKRGSKDDTVLIVSENTEYDPFELSRKNIYHIALVLGVIRLE